MTNFNFATTYRQWRGSSASVKSMASLDSLAFTRSKHHGFAGRFTTRIISRPSWHRSWALRLFIDERMGGNDAMAILGVRRNAAGSVCNGCATSNTRLDDPSQRKAHHCRELLRYGRRDDGSQRNKQRKGQTMTIEIEKGIEIPSSKNSMSLRLKPHKFITRKIDDIRIRVWRVE